MSIHISPVITDRTVYDKKYWKNIHGVDLAHWTDNSLFKLPFVTISYYYATVVANKHRSLRNVRDYLEVSKDITVLGDSGGFSLYTLGEDVDIKSLALWYNESVNIGVNPDVPFAKRRKPATIEKIKKCAEATAKRTSELIKYLEPHVELYLALHGRSVKEIELWYSIAVEPFMDRASGIASTSALNIYMPIHLLWIKENRIARKVHLLGISGSSSIFAYCLKDYFERITFDSQTHSAASKSAAFLVPYTSKYLYFGQRAKDGREKLPVPSSKLCVCPVCEFWANHYDITRLYSPDDFNSFHCLALHNLWAMANMYRICSIDFKYGYKIAGKITRKMMRFTTLGLKEGLDEALKTYPEFNYSESSERVEGKVTVDELI
ncbi:MAG: hypothetical protein QW104_05825 [Nitrososphaerota archaeon]